MFKITPIGSCRINTPLRGAEELYGFERDLSGIYGFSHNSAEAVQQVKFLNREYTPSAAVWPLIAPAQSMGKLLDEPHRPSDMYIVELSSAKRISINGECIQINYLYRHFEAFFKDKPRTRAFWALASNADQNKIDAFLDQCGIALTPAEFEFIRKLRFNLTTLQELRADVRYLLDTLPEVLFITHVDATTQNGHLIESRSNYISMVKTVVQSQGGKVYDPTELMRKFGQTNAIEDHSESLAHFTEPFSDALFKQWHFKFIFPLIERNAYAKNTPETKGNLERGIRGLLQSTPIVQVQKHVSQAIAELGPSSELADLQTYCHAELGDTALELDLLRAGLRDYPDNLNMLVRFMSLASVQHCAFEAYAFIKVDPAVIPRLSSTDLMALAKALEVEEHLAEALDCLIFTNGLMPENPLTISHLAQLALKTTHSNGIALCATILTTTSVDIDPSLTAKILLWQTQTDDFDTYLNRIGGMSLEAFFPVLSFLDDHGQESQIARAIASFASRNPDILNHVITKRIFDKWNTSLNTEVLRPKKLALLEQILRIDPNQRSARTTFKSIRQEIQFQVRAAIKADDINTIETLREEVALLSPPLVEFDLYLSRHYFKIKNWGMALDAAQNIVRTTPDHIKSWLMVMRCAFLLDDYALVDISAQKFIALAGPAEEKQVHEAKKRIARLPKLCVLAARQQPDPFKAWQLAIITARDPDLQAKSEQLFRINANKMVVKLRELTVSGHETFPFYIGKVLELVPDNERALTIAGKHFIALRDFSSALPYWEALDELRPNDTKIKAQLTRCNQTNLLAKAS